MPVPYRLITMRQKCYACSWQGVQRTHLVHLAWFDMMCSRRHSIQCVMTGDSPPSQLPPQPASGRQQSHRRLSTVGVMPRSGRCDSPGGKSSATRRRKTATSTRLQGSSIAALAAVARTPLLIGAVNHRKKSLPDNMLFNYVHALPSSRQRQVPVYKRRLLSQHCVLLVI